MVRCSIREEENPLDHTLTHSPFEVLALGVDLGFVVESAELGHQVGGVLRCVHRQRLGDDQQGAGELRNGQLLPGTLKTRD